MKMKCDICRKEFENSGIIFAKKKDGLDLLLCPECTKRIYREMEKALLEGAEYTGNSQEKHTF